MKPPTNSDTGATYARKATALAKCLSKFQERGIIVSAHHGPVSSDLCNRRPRPWRRPPCSTISFNPPAQTALHLPLSTLGNESTVYPQLQVPPRRNTTLSIFAIMAATTFSDANFVIRTPSETVSGIHSLIFTNVRRAHLVTSWLFISRPL